MGESITTTVFLWFLAFCMIPIHRGYEAASIAKFDNCTDRSDTPYFCVHNLMCYGYGQYCDPAEDKIQECLPAKNTLEWCIQNYQNVSAMPNFKCRYACTVRFDMSQLGPRSPDSDAVSSTQSPALSHGTTTQKESRSSEENLFSTTIQVPLWGLILPIIIVLLVLVPVILLIVKKCKKKPRVVEKITYSPLSQVQPDSNELVNIRSETNLQERQNNGPERDIPQDRGDASPTENSGCDPSSQENGSFSTNNGQHQENEHEGPCGQSSSATQVNTPTNSRGVPTVFPQQDGTSSGQMVPSGEQYKERRLQ